MDLARKWRILLFTCLCCSVGFNEHIIAQEVMKTIGGTITNSKTGELVIARVTYESLPYSNKIGFIEGNEFQFSVLEGNSYRLTVLADGYHRYQTEILPGDFKNNKVHKDIELMPDGKGETIRLDQLIFALGESEIAQESYSELNDLANLMKTNENMVIQLEGHTDTRGNRKLNMKLSEKRVKSVQKYLVKQGVSKKRIKTKAFGGTRPLTRTDTPESRKVNRRVEVRVLSK